MNRYDEPHPLDHLDDPEALERAFWDDRSTRQLSRIAPSTRSRRHAAGAAGAAAGAMTPLWERSGTEHHAGRSHHHDRITEAIESDALHRDAVDRRSAPVRPPASVRSVRSAWSSSADRSVDPFVRRLSLLIVIGLVALVADWSLSDGGEVLRTVETGGAVAIPDMAADVADATGTSVAVSTAAAAGVVPASFAPVVTDALIATEPVEALPTPAVEAAQPAVEAAPVVTQPATAQPATTQPAMAQPATTQPATIARISRSPDCSNTYIVVAGDSWIGIATDVGVSTKQLLAANGASARTVVFPGGKVCLPAGAAAPAPTPIIAAPKPAATTRANPSSGQQTKPVAAPVTTAAPATTQPSIRSYTAAENESIIRAVWPDDLEDEALRIARRESNLQNKAKNFCCYGLFQIYFEVHKKWLGGMGITSAAQLYDPTLNAQAAYTLYQRADGFGPWAL